MAGEGRLDEAILPVGDLLTLPSITLEEDAAWRFVHGTQQPMARSDADGRVKVFAASGLLGVGSLVGGWLRPEKVLTVEAAR